MRKKAGASLISMPPRLCLMLGFASGRHPHAVARYETRVLDKTQYIKLTSTYYNITTVPGHKEIILK